MSNLRAALTLSSAALLSACITAPMTPEQYRQTAKDGGGFSTFETFEVERPFAKVAQTFQQKVPECLSFTMNATVRPQLGFGSSTHQYGKATPTLKISNNKAEIHFQVLYENTVGKIPKDGMYHLVADAYPVEKNKTRVDIYRRTKVNTLSQAIHGWATGDSLGCPEMSSIM